jgi:hypothetical protein
MTIWYTLRPHCFNGNLAYVVAICYIIPVLYFLIKKNLATLVCMLTTIKKRKIKNRIARRKSVNRPSNGNKPVRISFSNDFQTG